VEKFEVSDDIVPLTDPGVVVPKTDVLAAGFPCQPFSKSGFQRGMDETRGTLFWNIARILADEEKRPSVVLLENVRNLAGPRHRDTTFKTIVRTLRELGYRTAGAPAVFSPHLLPPRLGGRPQVRERVFILAHYVGPEKALSKSSFDDPLVSPVPQDPGWRKEDWDLARDLPLQLDSEVDDRYLLEGSENKWVKEWDQLLTKVAARLGEGERLPGFPIWLHHFGDFTTLDGAERYIVGEEHRIQDELPRWKTNFLLQNGRWFERFGDIIEEHWPIISGFPKSRQKFEWQAGPHRPLADTIMHFRPSGIRAKRPDYVPALVAITQTSILGSRIREGSPAVRLDTARKLTPRETARLQGLPDWFEFRQSDPSWDEAVDQKDAASYKQMGNGVNVGAAYYVFRRYVLTHREEIPPHIVETVLAAPDNPDDRLAPRD
jgi:DNA (cytosine-5)-methyltransferase 1